MKKVIAVYGLTNSASVNIYEINHDTNEVLAGINNEKPKWYEIDYNDSGELSFLMGEIIDVPLNECIRI